MSTGLTNPHRKNSRYLHTKQRALRPHVSFFLPFQPTLNNTYIVALMCLTQKSPHIRVVQRRLSVHSNSVLFSVGY